MGWLADASRRGAELKASCMPFVVQMSWSGCPTCYTQQVWSWTQLPGHACNAGC